LAAAQRPRGLSVAGKESMLSLKPSDPVFRDIQHVFFASRMAGNENKTEKKKKKKKKRRLGKLSCLLEPTSGL